jgi:hypothetical protein
VTEPITRTQGTLEEVVDSDVYETESSLPNVMADSQSPQDLAEPVEQAGPNPEVSTDATVVANVVGRPDPFSLTLGQSKFGISFVSAHTKMYGRVLPVVPSRPQEISVDISTKLWGRCQLAAQGLADFQALQGKECNDPKRWGLFAADEFVLGRAKNIPVVWSSIFQYRYIVPASRPKTLREVFPSDDDMSTDRVSELGSLSRLITLLAFFFASFLYGGVHLLLAWDGPIHSYTELLLWRVSCFVLLAPWAFFLGYFVFLLALLIVIGLLVGIGFCCYYALNMSSWTIKEKLQKACYSMLKPYFPILKTYLPKAKGVVMDSGFGLALLYCAYAPFFIGMLLFCVLYLFSRVYVVVECLISLPFVSESVLMLPNWAVYFIHAS